MQQVVKIKDTGSPLANMARKQCLEAVNELDDTAIKNLLQLVNSKKARAYLDNNMKFNMLKMMI